MTSGEILCVRSELWRMAKIKDSTKSNFRIQISLSLNDKEFEEPIFDQNYLNQEVKFCKIFKSFQKVQATKNRLQQYLIQSMLVNDE